MQSDKNNSKTKIAVVVSHPIQHFCPAYRSWAALENVELKVFFGSTIGAKKYFDVNFGKEISWNSLYLDTFEHCFINGEHEIMPDKHIDCEKLDTILDEFNPDIIIGYGYSQKLQRRALRYSREKKILFCYISDSENRNTKSFIKRKIKHLFLNRYFSKPDIFLSVGDANEEYYVEYGVKKSKIVRCPFSIDIYSFEKVINDRQKFRNDFRAAFKIPGDAFVCITAGKFVSWKSQTKLLDAALNVTDKSIVFILAGSGEMEPELRAKAQGIKNPVIFTGFLAPEKLQQAYAASDLYIHTALYEPHSLSISEAIYMGLPAIVSDTTGSYGPADDVRPGLNGFVYAWNSPSTLGAYIERMANDPELYRSCSEYSRKIAVESQNKAHGAALQKVINLYKENNCK